MSDESQQEVVLADTTAASDQEATVAPETEVVTPEAVTPKTYTQEDFDAAKAKALGL